MSQRILRIMTITLLLALVGTAYTNCRYETLAPIKVSQVGGTGVGNPMTQVAAKLVTVACTAISRCHPDITTTECESALHSQSGLDYQLGLPTGEFPHFKSVVLAEAAGQVDGNAELYAACSQTIAHLSCDSPQLQGAYLSTRQGPYWGAPRVFLNQACSQVLHRKSPVTANQFNYIRSGATGRGDGSDWENACPDFSGPCGGDQLVRGHTYFVASGDYSAVTFEVPGHDVITIKKATADDHGTQVGWQDQYARGPAAFPSWSFRSSHWVIDGQQRSSLETGHGFKIDLPRLNPHCPNNFCNAILLESDSIIDRVTLRFVEIAGYGATSARSQNGVYSVPIEGSSSNIVLYGLSLHDFGVHNGNSPIKTSGKGVVNLTFENSAIIRSQARPVSDTGSDFVTFHNNWFENISDQGAIVVMGDEVSQNWAIHGNVFWESDPSSYGVNEGLIQCGNQMNCQGWRIVNNTFVNFTSERSKYSHINFDLAHPSSSDNRAYNNIWFNCTNPGIFGPGLESDFNMYLRTTNPLDEPAGIVDNFDPFLQAATGNFHLRSATPAGLSLASPFDFGRDGQVRGQDGNWDRGAFEYSPDR